MNRDNSQSASNCRLVALVAGLGVVALGSTMAAAGPPGELEKRIVIGAEHGDRETVEPSDVPDIDRRISTEVRIGGDDDGPGLSFDARLDYQRVDGISFELIERFRGRGETPPLLTLSQARAFNRGRWLFAAEYEQPLFFPGFSVGGSFFRRTAIFDDLDPERVGDVENLLAALLVKEDFRDYHEDEGVSAFVAQQIRSVTVRASVIRSQHRAVKNSVRTSLTRWDEDFRLNPAADEGDYRAVRLAADYDTRPSHRSPATAQWWRLALESAGGDLGGDFDFSRLLLDVRNYLRTSPGQQLSWRLVYGTKLSGTTPLQRRFGIGGVGTLRGHSFKQFNGEDVLLGNVEYRFDFSNHSFAMVFLDTGATADAGGSLDKQQFALDGGVGIGLQSERAALYLARDVRDASADIKVNFRLASTF